MQPRGLQNPGNLCFMNSVLQALMGGSSFCRLLDALSRATPVLDSASTPALTALAAVASSFKPHDVVSPASSNSAAKDCASLLGGDAATAGPLLDIVERFSPQRKFGTSLAQLEQEDAQEFLAYLMDALHQELLVLKEGGAASAETSPTAAHCDEDDQSEDGWLTKAGKRTVKQQEVSAAPQEAATVVTALFQGKIATSVSCARAPTSVTVHPFTILGLPLGSDHIRSVADALDALMATETLLDYKPREGAAPMQASKMERFHKLPHILVLHLMRFQYNGRSTKVNKAVAFEPRLMMRSGWLAAGCKERRMEYELVATVSHHGKNSTSGHYTADVIQPDGRWLRFDDGNVFSVSQQAVMSDRTYLLFYQRVAGCS